jgi:hypothetical protein
LGRGDQSEAVAPGQLSKRGMTETARLTGAPANPAAAPSPSASPLTAWSGGAAGAAAASAPLGAVAGVGPQPTWATGGWRTTDCRYFLQGRCTRGTLCRFRHDRSHPSFNADTTATTAVRRYNRPAPVVPAPQLMVWDARAQLLHGASELRDPPKTHKGVALKPAAAGQKQHGEPRDAPETQEAVALKPAAAGHKHHGEPNTPPKRSRKKKDPKKDPRPVIRAPDNPPSKPPEKAPGKSAEKAPEKAPGKSAEKAPAKAAERAAVRKRERRRSDKAAHGFAPEASHASRPSEQPSAPDHKRTPVLPPPMLKLPQPQPVLIQPSGAQTWRSAGSELKTVPSVEEHKSPSRTQQPRGRPKSRKQPQAQTHAPSIHAQKSNAARPKQRTRTQAHAQIDGTTKQLQSQPGATPQALTESAAAAAAVDAKVPRKHRKRVAALAKKCQAASSSVVNRGPDEKCHEAPDHRAGPASGIAPLLAVGPAVTDVAAAGAREFPRSIPVVEGGGPEFPMMCVPDLEQGELDKLLAEGADLYASAGAAGSADSSSEEASRSGLDMYSTATTMSMPLLGDSRFGSAFSAKTATIESDPWPTSSPDSIGSGSARITAPAQSAQAQSVASPPRSSTQSVNASERQPAASRPKSGAFAFLGGLLNQLVDRARTPRNAISAAEIATALVPVADLPPVLDTAEIVVADECVFCLSRPATHLISACNHQCLCGDCSKRFVTASAVTSHPFSVASSCPVCRSPIASISDVRL